MLLRQRPAIYRGWISIIPYFIDQKTQWKPPDLYPPFFKTRGETPVKNWDALYISMKIIRTDIVSM